MEIKNDYYNKLRGEKSIVEITTQSFNYFFLPRNKNKLIILIILIIIKSYALQNFTGSSCASSKGYQIIY